MNGQKDIVEYLVNKAANVLIKNVLGKTAAQEAYEKCFFEISEILADKEISLDKDNIIQSGVDKNNQEDHIDLDNLDIQKLDLVD
jgi:hypothetical protein